MNVRVVFSALAMLALVSAGASAQVINPEDVEQTERAPMEDARLPRCPGDPRCGQQDTILIDDLADRELERMAREPMGPRNDEMGEDGGRMPRCPGDPRCQRDGAVRTAPE